MSLNQYVNELHYEKKSKLDEKSATVEQLVENNLKFVVQTAHKYKQFAPLNDLIQEGNLGLIEAASRFDTKKNCKFITYAVWYVKDRMFKFMKNNFPVHKGIGKCKMVYIDSKVAPGKSGDATYERILNVEDRYELPHKEMILTENATIIHKALENHLNPMERDIIKGRYCIDNNEKVPLREFANKYHFTIPNVCVVEKRALKKLKKVIKEQI